MSARRGGRRRRGTGESGGKDGRPPSGGGLAIPGWLPPVLFAVTTLLLFREFVFSDEMLYGGDTLSLGYMAREFYAEAVRQGGVFPRWNPLILGGTPFLESLAGGDSLYPTSLLLFILEPYRALGWKLVIHVFLGGLFMFGWIRSLGRSRAAALLAGLAFAVAPFMVTLVHPGHDGKLFVTALTPLLFWAMERTFVGRGLLPYVGVALVVALVLFTTHFQLAYFLFGAAGAYYAFRCITLWRGVHGAPRGLAHPLVRFGVFLAASVAGAATAGIQLIPAVDYVTEFSRRTATTTQASPEENLLYASSWSLHPEEAVAFVVPEFAGNDAGGAAWAQGSYWGQNPFKDNHEYAGLVVLLLAVAGFFGGRRRALRWFFAVLGTTAVLYALGAHTPVWRIFYEVFPGVSLFRAPSMVSFLFGFSAITLAAFGVDRILAMVGGEAPADGPAAEAGGVPPEESDSRLVSALWILAAVLGLGMLLAASGALFSVWTSVFRPDIDPGNLQQLQAQRPYIVRGFFVATALAAAVAATVWAGRKGYLKPFGVALILGVLLLFDGFRISGSFIETLDFRQWSQPDPIVEHLLAAQRTEPPFRVADLGRQAQEVRSAMFGLELATGHHPNDLGRYRELIGMQGSGFPTHLGHPNVQALLNVRYLVVPGALEAGPEPVLQTRAAGGQVYESLYELPALPRARLVADALVVPEDRTVEAILDPEFDPATTAILNEELPAPLGGGMVQGGVEWVERGINRQVLRVTSDRDALLVVADNWFPAWQARVDGEGVPLLRAYHTLRAVPVPAGEHTVEIVYDSPTLQWSLGLSLATLALLLGVALASWLRARRGRDAAGG